MQHAMLANTQSIIDKHPVAVTTYLLYAGLTYLIVRGAVRYQHAKALLSNGANIAAGEGVFFGVALLFLIAIIFASVILIFSVFRQDEKRFYYWLSLGIMLPLQFGL
jgi:hypothetical protein